MDSNSVKLMLSIGLLMFSRLALASGGGAHGPITIQNDADFVGCNCVLGGDGSSSNPFSIGPWSITKVDGVAVSIDGTDLTKSLVIWNLTVGGNGTDSSMGIVLKNINRGAHQYFAAVEGAQTTIQAVGVGIQVDSSSDIVLDGGDANPNGNRWFWRGYDQSQSYPFSPSRRQRC